MSATVSVTSGKASGVRVGEYNAEVLSGWLGMSPQEVEALRQDGIV